MRRFAFLAVMSLPILSSAWFACAGGSETNGTTTAGEGGSGAASQGGAGPGGMTATGTGGLGLPDGGSDGPIVDPDSACATSVQQAETKQLPVDILWMVDNSASMQPAIAQVTSGLNAFASLIAAKNLDYKVIMLSLRGKNGPIVIGGSNRYPVCIPQPLAGDTNCGNGARFFQSSVDIRSTQPLEQFLGTLAQTAGYQEGEEKGGEPWQPELRADATKTIVVVTDDNARLSADEFETFPGGKNPFNSLTLPPGILDSSWNGLFKDYVFSGIYGWGSDTDPDVKCVYSGGSSPPSSGPTYTTLVTKTGGARAKICDGSAAWGPFFEAVAQAVVETSKLSCTVDIPKPDVGELDPAAVNVQLVVDGTPTTLVKVKDAAACGTKGGWYYDNDTAPTQVLLCPASCALAEESIGVGKSGSIEVLFGCATIAE